MSNELKCQNCSPAVVEQCIERMPLSAGAKRLLRKAFAEGAVTPLMEQHLQQACPELVKSQPATDVKQRGLWQRVRLMSSGSEMPVDEKHLMEDSPTLLMDAREIQALLRKQREQATKPAPEPPEPGRAPILYVPRTGHRILLPRDGSLTLGCLDPLSRIFPDVDLTYDDHQHSVAFLHARVIARHSKHFIEDFGSLTGTWLNDKRLDTKREYPLHADDRVRLGSCEMVMATAPPQWSAPARVYRLCATASGRLFLLPPVGEVTLGRADPHLGFSPTINLNTEGDVALLVSRQHAALRCHEGQLEVTDLGSSNGTKVDGLPVPKEAWIPLWPGQHLWLGGFCLGVDVELRET